MESRRVDNQARGRSGRQGDEGCSIFYVSLEDDLMRIFGSDKMDSVLKSLGLKEGESIKHVWISKALERAQKKVEGRNFDIRKTLLKFDDVLNDQRKTIFEQRLDLMNSDDVSEVVKEMQYDVADEIVNNYAPEKSYIEQWNTTEIKNDIKTYFAGDIDLENQIKNDDFDQEKLKNRIYQIIDKRTQIRAENHPQELVNNLEKMVLLKIIDDKWMMHINNLEQLRGTIGLRGYGQRDPLNEYKNEAFGLFEDLIFNLKNDVAKIFSRMSIRPGANLDQDTNNKELKTKTKTTGQDAKKVPRNSPCPCGSGKKYKHCHGKIN